MVGMIGWAIIRADPRQKHMSLYSNELKIESGVDLTLPKLL
jgi:hypothetical protein